MDNIISALKRDARRNGSCNLINEVNDYKQLVQLFFSAQGLEFCQKYDYPSIDVLRTIADKVGGMGMFIDSGSITINSRNHICIAGKTQATILASGVDYVHKIVVMRGASAHIKADNYAVLAITNIGGGCVDIDKDNTVVVL